MVGISIGSAWYRRPPGCFACGSIIIQPRLKHSIKESLVATHFAQSRAICAVLWASTFIVAGNSANAQQICQTNVGYCSMRSYDQPGHFCRCPYLHGYANVDGVIYNSGSQALLSPDRARLNNSTHTNSHTDSPTNRPIHGLISNVTSRTTNNQTSNSISSPTSNPTNSHTNSPTTRPTRGPIGNITSRTTNNQTSNSIRNPTSNPTNSHTNSPTHDPTSNLIS